MSNSSIIHKDEDLEKSHAKNASPARTINSYIESEKCFDSGTLNCNRLKDSEEPTNPNDFFFDSEKEKNSEKPCDDNTNKPHPALEFAPFYFLIQNHPAILEWARLLYHIRWIMSYPFQRNICGSRFLSKFGIYITFGEVLFMIPLIGATVGGVLYTALYPNVMSSGQMSRFLVISSFLLAQRNSYVTFLFGLSVDRAIFYHKASGRLALLGGILHGISYTLDPDQKQMHHHQVLFGAFDGSMCISGSILLILLLLLTMSSLPWIRSKVFEVFYYTHLLCIGGILVCTLFHSGILVPILILGTWGFDLFVRSVIMARVKNAREAKVSTISDSVTEICIQKTKKFSYNPGQYIYIAIPEISWTQWHPFSIASAPNEDTVKLYVRKAGNWTNALFELASSKSTIDVLVEGPNGSLSVDILGDHSYRSVMLLSGGIGVTPMQSICKQLLFEEFRGTRKLDLIKFIWIERDPLVVQKSDIFDQSERSSRKFSQLDTVSHENNSVMSDFFFNIAVDILISFPPANETEEYFEINYRATDSELDDVSVIFDNDEIGSLSNPDELEDPVENVEDILDAQIYVTGERGIDQNAKCLRKGRPDIKVLFQEMRHHAIEKGEKRVAVYVCAPLKLTMLCQKAAIVFSDSKLRFDIHVESLGF